ncbi:MAG: alpha-ketoglutarate-dependent dioxygenase AlkB [Porticoccaceae bacterium]
MVSEREIFPLLDGELHFWQQFLLPAESAALFDRLIQETPWEQSMIRIAGRPIPTPRLNAWYGDRGADYGYSGVSLRTLPWTQALAQLRTRVEHATGHSFNSALVNLYRNERDSVDWHSDNEAELGPKPVVASLSLGETRCFELRRRDNHRDKRKLALADGALLLMAGDIQRHWQHRVGKERYACGARINITFRTVHNGRYR